MNRKRIFLITCAAILAASSILLTRLSAQSPVAAQPGEHAEPVQLLVDYADGKQKRRISHHGMIESVGFPAGQPVTLTLQFLRKRAGEVISIIPLDGGRVTLPERATLSAEGAVTFTFHGTTLGLHRLLINGPQHYELSLYGVDPNSAPPRRGK